MDDETLVPLIERLAGEVVARLPLDRLAQEIAARLPRTVSPEIELWDASMVATYLGVTPARVREHYSTLPGFPVAIRLPATGSKPGHPRWKAAEIIDWAERRRERRPRPERSFGSVRQAQARMGRTELMIPAASSEAQ
ncbi:MAG: hypothetical protein QJR02_11330 [Sinobacteraceae bacterium]|nr:hypothetical protein [Nevskiaceae bacterium]